MVICVKATGKKSINTEQKRPTRTWCAQMTTKQIFLASVLKAVLEENSLASKYDLGIL